MDALQRRNVERSFEKKLTKKHYNRWFTVYISTYQRLHQLDL